MKPKILSAAIAALLMCTAAAEAQQEVKIGIIQPLSGPVAQVGIDAVAAVKTAVELVNEGADVSLPLAKGKGLPGLQGAKVKLFISDHQGKPEIGMSEAERLITQ